MAFFPPGQGRKGQGIRAGQVEKKCPVDITASLHMKIKYLPDQTILII
jgi:hypothetical protein